ncbi:unnamed protein product [Ectocarpus sp. 4 AP-2014]
MMVKNRGLPAALGGHYNKYLGQLIQRATGTGSRVAPSPRSGRPPSTQQARARGVGSPGAYGRGWGGMKFPR